MPKEDKSSQPHIHFRSVTKSFGAVKVIPDLNLTINQGEFVVLVGPSGCGKTTTLRMLAGLETVSGGEISIGDRDVTNLPPGERNCSMVFQNYALYPHMSVRENIGYAMKVHAVPENERNQRVDDAAELLGLQPYLDRKPKNLSGGQRQRVAIGRALVRQPEVFLFDEPLSNLDAKLRVDMRTEIKILQQRLGTTAVYVTHDQVEALTMADRVVVMRDGVIEQVDAPIELYERPANRFVANFIGSPAMNFFDAVVNKDTLDIGDQKLKMSDEMAQRASKHKTLILGIRPEHMNTGNKKNTLNFNVRAVEPLGSHTLLLAQLYGKNFTAQVNSNFAVKPGGATSVHPDMDKAHIFDAKTELSL